MVFKTDLAMAKRHVAEGERHVRLQRSIIARLKKLGEDTTVAREVEHRLEDLLALHRQELAQLERPTNS
jgi:hypothetical protein